MLESVTSRKDSTMHRPDNIFVMNKIENIFISEITGKSKQISKSFLHIKISNKPSGDIYSNDKNLKWHPPILV